VSENTSPLQPPSPDTMIIPDLEVNMVGTVTHPPGTIVMTVVIPRELPLKTVRTIKEAVKLTLRYGALVETLIVDDPREERAEHQLR